MTGDETFETTLSPELASDERALRPVDLVQSQYVDHGRPRSLDTAEMRDCAQEIEAS